MSVVFANVRYPAPNALCERLAQQMESHLGEGTWNGTSVYRGCLRHVRFAFTEIGGSPGSALFAGTAWECNQQLAGGGVNRNRQAVPRGAVCLWNNATGDGAGHIAIADGKGNSVNNWGGSAGSARIVTTPLSSQGDGWIGWVWPDRLGRPPGHLTRSNPDYTGKAIPGGTWGSTGTGADDTPSKPLPKPPKLPAGSGRSKPGLGDDTWTVNGAKASGALEGLVSSTVLDLAVQTVAEVTLSVIDPDQRLAGLNLDGALLGWDGAAWDLSASSIQAAAATVELHARSILARRMRRTYRVVGEHKAGPDEWTTKWVRALGGKAVVQKTGKRAVIPEGTDQSVADVLDALCQALGGWSWTEYAGIVYAGSRIWAYDGGTGLPVWPLTWKTAETTDVLDVAAELTTDDPDNRGSAQVLLRWEQGRRLRPWHRLDLSGLGGRYDGRWLVEAVQTPNDGVGQVQVTCARPRRASQESTSPSSQSAPKDKRTPAYAKWFAKRQLSRHGWGEAQWDPLDKLWTRESGWRWNAENSSSGAYGIPQALPGSKMASAGKDWRTNPETQIRWGLGYIKGRYGTPARAWTHSEQNGWY